MVHSLEHTFCMIIRETWLNIFSLSLLFILGSLSDFPWIRNDWTSSQRIKHPLEFNQLKEFVNVQFTRHIVIQDIEYNFSLRWRVRRCSRFNSFLYWSLCLEESSRVCEMLELVIFCDWLFYHTSH